MIGEFFYCIYAQLWAPTPYQVLHVRLRSGEMDLNEFRAMIAVLMPHLGQPDEAS